MNSQVTSIVEGRKTSMANTPKISLAALREVEAALNQYVNEVIATDLTDATKDVYAYHSQNFVRWLSGDFTPGINKR